jgi:TPR repeat protein
LSRSIIISYVYGEAVPQDYARVFGWVRRPADEGDATARVMLGLMYAEGHGVPQDYAQAHMWFNLAAAHAEDPAMRDTAAKDRDRLAANMTPDQIAEAQRLAREWKATK